MRRGGDEELIGPGGQAAREFGRGAGFRLQQFQEGIEECERIVHRFTHHQAGLVDKAEGSRGIVEQEFHDIEHVSDAQVVAEGPVLVLVGEDGVFVIVLPDLGKFHFHSGGDVLRNCEKRHAGQNKSGKDSFHCLDH